MMNILFIGGTGFFGKSFINYINTNKTLCDHLEIETYTWEVLPSSVKTEIASSIIREIEWLKLKL